jgi:hypothetical protein
MIQSIEAQAGRPQHKTVISQITQLPQFAHCISRLIKAIITTWQALLLPPFWEVRMHRAHVKSGGRYPVLRALGILSMVGALGIVLMGIYAVGWSLFAAPANMSEKMALAGGALVGTFVLAVAVLAFAELIKLMIDVEHNTRMGAMGGAAPAAGNGSAAVSVETHSNRLTEIDEESAEAALLRGH